MPLLLSVFALGPLACAGSIAYEPSDLGPEPEPPARAERADAAPPPPNGAPPRDASIDAAAPDAGFVVDAGAPEAAVDAAVSLVPAVGDLLFTELMINPTGAVQDITGEWIEVRNVSNRTLELMGCTLEDTGVNGDNHTIATTTRVTPGGRVVLAKSATAAVNGGLPRVDYAFGETGVSLTNGGDTLILRCAGAILDTLTYNATWPFVEGVAMQLDDTLTLPASNDSPTAWCRATATYGTQSHLGTPGSANGRCR